MEKIKGIEGKTKDELVKLGYELELQCEGGDVAYIIWGNNMSLIGILQDNGTFQIDYDSDIYIN